MSIVYRRYLPILITFICGIIMIIQYFLVPPNPTEPYQTSLNKIGTDLTNWTNLIGAFTAGFGLVNILLLHSKHITRRTPGQWYFSVWLLIMMFLMVIIGIGGEPAIGINVTGFWYDWMQVYVFGACSGAMYASIAFYITSATIRSFRARTLQATALLVIGFLTLMSRTPALQVYPWIVDTADWINSFLVKSSFRGITIGAALGAILLGIRTLMGMETGYFGRRD